MHRRPPRKGRLERHLQRPISRKQVPEESPGHGWDGLRSQEGGETMASGIAEMRPGIERGPCADYRVPGVAGNVRGLNLS